MRKLILILLVAISIAQAATFQRPWENKTWVAQNPNVWSYGIEIWWNLPELDQTLTSLDLSHAAANGTSQNYLDASIAARQSATAHMRECMAFDIINPLWALGGALGMAVGATLEALSEFSETAACLQYGSDWVTTVDAALNAVEQSTKDAERSIADARSGYEEMKFAGLCDRNYTGPGSEHCAAMDAAFTTAASNITEGEYGKYPLLLEYHGRFSRELGRPEPDLSVFRTMIALVWAEDGIIIQSKELRETAEASVAEAELEFLILQNSVETKKGLAESDLHELETQKIGLITIAPATTEARAAGSVSEVLASIQNQKDQLSVLFQEAKLERARLNKKSHLATAIFQMQTAEEGYGELSSSITTLEEDAEESEAQQKAEARAELAQTELFIGSAARSSEALSLYQQAEASFRAGERAKTLGESFSAYAKAAALARAARNERTYEEELAVTASLQQLENLIENAEIDDINVVEEKEALLLLKSLKPYEIEPYAQSAIGSIIAKAKAKYEHNLLETRARLFDKLFLAGPATADLYTDLTAYEKDIFNGAGGIDYPSAIGRLKILKENYLTLEATLDAYASLIVGNGMSVSAAPLMEDVRLDEPAVIVLDAVLTNPRDYGADNVSAKISMQTPVQFLYSDLTMGKTDVESIRMTDSGKTIVLIFSHVEPFESKHVLFEKQSIVAHTISREVNADGIGNDAAYLSEKLDFELDSSIWRLTLPPGFEDATIDGAGAARPLLEGMHVLISERVVDDAYGERITNIKAYAIGTNSRVEYDIEITPKIDLDSALIFLESLNDSRISNLDVVAMTGQLITDKKRISETEYTAKVLSLEEGAVVVLKVSYTVENTQSLVLQQLAQLEAANLSSGAWQLLAMARQQADAGNYTKALELIEQSKALSKEESKEIAKLQKKYDELGRQVRDELDELTRVLSGTDASGAFIDRLSARKAELERVLGESESANLSEKVHILEEVDYNWLTRELTSFKKDAYKEYNDLKERFFEAGNSSTPTEFLGFESALSQLQAGGRLEYAVEALEALDAVKTVVLAQENTRANEGASLRAAFNSLEAATREVLDRYLKEASSAKGTEYSSLFTESEKSVEKKISDTEAAIAGDGRIFWLRHTDLNKSRQRMLLTLGSLENESEAKLSMLGLLLERSFLDDAKRSAITQKLQIMRNMVAAGEYVNALRAGSAIAKELESSTAPDNSLLVLAVTAIAVLATIAVYIIKQQKESGKERKKLRKLERTKDSGLPKSGAPNQKAPSE